MIVGKRISWANSKPPTPNQCQGLASYSEALYSSTADASLSTVRAVPSTRRRLASSSASRASTPIPPIDAKRSLVSIGMKTVFWLGASASLANVATIFLSHEIVDRVQSIVSDGIRHRFGGVPFGLDFALARLGVTIGRFAAALGL